MFQPEAAFPSLTSGRLFALLKRLINLYSPSAQWEEMRVNVTVITFNRLALTRLCLESLLKTTKPSCRVTVVDNASTDGTGEYLDGLVARSDRVAVYKLARNMGVSVAINLGMAEADADFFVRMDNDIELRKPGWLEEMIAIAGNNAEVGLVGYQFCSWHTMERIILGSGHAFRKAGACGGGCMLVPRKTFEAYGFMNEDYGKYGFEDLDYSNRVIMGGQIVGYVDDDISLKHLGYERDVDPRHEEIKRVTRTSDLAGEKLYLLNKLLFEEGIRNCYVPRKYLPGSTGPDGIRFQLNEAYKTIMKMNQTVLHNFTYTTDGEQVKLDLSLFRNAAKDPG